MKNINPTQTQAWKELEEHFKEVGQLHMRDLFREDPGRADKFSIEWEDFYVDFSKNRFDEKAQSLLLKLAEECGLEEAIDSYFKGDAINRTENRAVLHTALRSLPDAEVMVGAENVIPEVESVKKKIKEFTDEVGEEFENFIGEILIEYLDEQIKAEQEYTDDEGRTVRKYNFEESSNK